MLKTVLAFCTAFVLTFSGVSQAQSAGAAEQHPSNPGFEKLASLEPIDTHTHVAKGGAAFYAMLEHLHMHILDILLVDDHEAYRKAMQPQLNDALKVVHDSHGYAALCTSIDPFQFNQPDFSASAIRDLNRDFADGAVAVKIWKNIGMELKDRDGHYVLPDNPAFEPIFQDIEQHDKTLIAHLAEPDTAWHPPDPKALDYSYYQENPVWYMYNKPGAPTKQQAATISPEQPPDAVGNRRIGSPSSNVHPASPGEL